MLPPTKDKSVRVDAIPVEVIRAALNSAAERMRITMIKTAYNHIITESLDFGCTIFDADVRMIAKGVGLPVFQGHLGFPFDTNIRDPGIDAFRQDDALLILDLDPGNRKDVKQIARTKLLF